MCHFVTHLLQAFTQKGLSASDTQKKALGTGKASQDSALDFSKSSLTTMCCNPSALVDLSSFLQL